MAKNVDTVARQAYKRAVTDFLESVNAINVGCEVAHGVGFWRNELQPILGRHLAKLASVELPEVKRGKAAADDACAVALAKVTAERDALAARLASLGKGERAKVREARAEADEAWQRYGNAPVWDDAGCNPDPEEPEFSDCEEACYAD